RPERTGRGAAGSPPAPGRRGGSVAGTVGRIPGGTSAIVSPAALHSLWALAGLLFLDGMTFSFATTPLMLRWGQYHPAWQVALVGSLASAAGGAFQLLLLRWVMAGERPWMRRLAPSRQRIEDAVARHPSASFLALVIARA